MHPAKALGIAHSIKEAAAPVGAMAGLGASALSLLNRLFPSKQWGKALTMTGRPGQITETAKRMAGEKIKVPTTGGTRRAPRPDAQRLARLNKLKGLQNKAILNRQKMIGGGLMGAAGLGGSMIGSELTPPDEYFNPTY